MALSFKETFLLAYTSIRVVLKMFFFTFFNTNIRFVKKNLFKCVILLQKPCLLSRELNLLVKKNLQSWH